MIALRRTDVRALNRLARDLMRRAGHLTGPEIEVGGEPISACDIVVLRLNDSRRGVANGDRGTVRAVSESSISVEIAGRLVQLDFEYLQRLTHHSDPVVAHGYAVTGHVAQGLTTDRAFVLASDELYREWTYTAMSRGRELNRLYVVDSPSRVRDEIAPIYRTTPESDLLGLMRQSRRQRLAVDTREDGWLPDAHPAQSPTPNDRETRPNRRWWRRARRDDSDRDQAIER